MMGSMDKSMNIFLYFNQEEIKKLPNGLEGKLYKYSTEKASPFQINCNFRNPYSADWEYLKESNNKRSISIGKQLYKNLLEGGRGYTRIQASGGAEIFLREISRLDIIEEVTFDQLKFYLKHIQ